MDYIVHGVTKSQTRLSDFHFQLFLKYIDSSPLCFHAFICVSRVCVCVCVSWIIRENWNMNDVYIF